MADLHTPVNSISLFDRHAHIESFTRAVKHVPVKGGGGERLVLPGDSVTIKAILDKPSHDFFMEQWHAVKSFRDKEVTVNLEGKLFTFFPVAVEIWGTFPYSLMLTYLNSKPV